ncbi:hypothetical protein FA13DRAFT_1391514 [Coprinellus micaceus]|uniref:Uncharacterized protein n=1 Tax=Coprinellus micaceus TaxID=71717 RepID=A0A4Y7SQI2_COPMI|nr:hypothetical protein FA13DRAFT_1391514 [Coprinellus micaceus]
MPGATWSGGNDEIRRLHGPHGRLLSSPFSRGSIWTMSRTEGLRVYPQGLLALCYPFLFHSIHPFIFDSLVFQLTMPVTPYLSHNTWAEAGYTIPNPSVLQSLSYEELYSEYFKRRLPDDAYDARSREYRHKFNKAWDAFMRWLYDQNPGAVESFLYPRGARRPSTRGQKEVLQRVYDNLYLAYHELPTVEHQVWIEEQRRRGHHVSVPPQPNAEDLRSNAQRILKVLEEEVIIKPTAKEAIYEHIAQGELETHYQRFDSDSQSYIRGKLSKLLEGLEKTLPREYAVRVWHSSTTRSSTPYPGTQPFYPNREVLVAEVRMRVEAEVNEIIEKAVRRSERQKERREDKGYPMR